MESNQRKRILRNVDTLVNLTEFNKLVRSCIDYNLLSQVMVQNIYHVEPEKLSAENCVEDAINRERHKKLFVKITKRGPDAFEKLRRIFIDLKYKEASKILFGIDERMISISSSKEKGEATSGNEDISKENNDNVDDRDGTEREFSRLLLNDNDITLHKYKDIIRPKKDVNVRKAKGIIKHTSIDTYPMESKNNRGVFFMVNIVNFAAEEHTRLGADEDARSLLSLFGQLGFKLYPYKNISQKKLFELLDELLMLDEIKETECFVMALMTHGQLVDGVQLINFTDGSVVKVEEIEKRFYHENCTQLVGKPKIFIYPYCRGEISDKGINLANKTQTEGIGNLRRLNNNIAQLSDVIKCYATTAGFVAHRDIENGSWYIQSFVDIMAEYAHNTSFEEMLKMIQAGIAKLRTNCGELQTASYVNIGFNKILYFNPGIYKN